MANDLDFITDNMTWSFSRLNSFYSNCKYEWYMHYIECLPAVGGFFGEFGGYCHKILEKYLKGELGVFDLAPYYEEHYSEEVVSSPPPNNYVDLGESYYNKGLGYFESFADYWEDNYEIIGVEKEIHFEIDGKPFIGFIDLLLRNKETGAIKIVDHKSASIKMLKNGNVSKSDADHFLEFKRQLYLYSNAIKEEFPGVPIEALEWNMFKQGDTITIPYDDKEYLEALWWASDTIKAIEEEEEWPSLADKFYCWNLCSMRENACPYKP